MTDASIDTPSDALLNGPDSAGGPSQTVIAQVAKDFGVHPLRQMKHILSMRMGAQKLGSNEYYDLRIFDPVHDRKARKAFLGQGGINALNLAMNPDSLMETKNFVGNKMAYTHHLNESGIASTVTQAFVSADVDSELDIVLKNATVLEAFMREKAEYPVFGKPLGGSLSVGSVRIDGIDGDLLQLGNGHTIEVDQFARDVMRVYPDGYLLQTALAPHKDMARVAGDAVGSLRIVTTNTGDGATPTYALWKIPAPKAMSDNFWQDGSMLALVDLADGTVLNCHRGKGPDAEMLETHPVSGAPVVGMKLPFWSETLASAVAAHDLFPDLGICGFDIAVTDAGPVVLECNDKPNHLLYQFPARQGIQNAALAPVWKAVIKRQKKAA